MDPFVVVPALIFTVLAVVCSDGRHRLHSLKKGLGKVLIVHRRRECASVAYVRSERERGWFPEP